MSNEKNNVGLSDVMEGNTPRHNTTIIDVTKGKVEPEKENNEEVATNKTEEAAPKKKKSVVAVTDENTTIDSETVQEVNPFDILPKKEVKVETYNDTLMNALDMAVDREKKSITKRIDALYDKMEEEQREIAEEKDIARMEKEDAETMNEASSVINNIDDGDDYGYDDEDDIDISAAPEYANKTSLKLDLDDDHTEKDVNTTEEDSVDESKAIVAEEVVEETKAVAKDEEKPVVEEKKEEKKVVIKEEVKPNETTSSILDGIDDSELFDDTEETSDDSSDDDEAEKQFEELKSEVKKKINPIRKVFDLSKFTIAQKSMNAQKVMKLAIQSHQNVADWVLYSQNRPISLSGLSGPEILKLNPENSNRNRLNTFRDMYRIIYDHVIDANKPEFETWLKQIHFVDIQHIYFGLYMATFGGSNFITYSCTNNKCNNVFIKDVKFEDMIKYKDDSVKNKVKEILKKDTTTPVDKDTYEAELYQVSDNYVFAIKNPTIWNVIMETATLSDRFLANHADLIDLVSYIDKIYLVDAKNSKLIPIDTKPDPNDQAKTSARRIRTFYDIISTLNSQDFYNLRAKITEFDKLSDELTYQIPAATCPKCATEIPANTDVVPENMLFTRHQLAAIGNM